MKAWGTLVLLLTFACNGAREEASHVDEAEHAANATQGEPAESETAGPETVESEAAGPLPTNAEQETPSGDTAGADNSELESETDAPNFLVYHHCPLPQPCTLTLDTLTGVVPIDLGSRHSAPPSVCARLSVGEGNARLGSLQATADRPAEGPLSPLPRPSLLGDAYALQLRGEGNDVTVQLTACP